jgi:hypothetical protein
MLPGTRFMPALVQLFRAPAVLGSYLNLTMAAWVLALVLVAATRGRIGYRPEVDMVFIGAAESRTQKSKR